MSKHGEIRKTYERTYLVKNETFNKKAKVVELSKLDVYTVQERYCAKCEEWQDTDSRYFITDYLCPECGVNWITGQHD